MPESGVEHVVELEVRGLLSGDETGSSGSELCNIKEFSSNTLKSYIGAGCLALPAVVGQAGIGFSAIIYPIIMLLAVRLMILLTHTFRAVKSREALSGIDIDSLGKLGAAISPLQRVIVEVATGTFTFGICVAYEIYGVANDPITFQEGTLLQGVILFVILAPLCCIPNLKKLSFVSVIGVTFLVLSLLTVFAAAVLEIATNGVKPITWFDPKHCFTMLGVAIYTFEGIAMVIPLFKTMQKPDLFGSVTTICLSCLVFLFLLVSITCNLAFGSVSESIADHIPWGFARELVRILSVIAILISYPVMIVPLFEIIEQRCPKKWVESRYFFYSLRLSMVAITTIVAICLRHFFAVFLALIGATMGSYISFWFPAYSHFKLVPNAPVADRLFDLCCMVLAVFFACATGYSSMRKMIG